MYIDLMSQYNHLQVNIKLANTLNLNIAVYWAELMNVYARVVNKKKEETEQNDGFFQIDREYVKRRTTLSIEDQLVCDAALEKLGILAKKADDPNNIAIDIKAMYALIVEDDATAIKEIQKKSKVKRDEAAAAKKEMLKANLIAAIEEDDVDILEALKTWISEVIEAKKPLSKVAVEVFQKNLHSYTDQKVVKLQLIEIATVHTWIDFAWAKNSYEKDYKKPIGTFISVDQKKKVGIDMNSGF